MTSITLMSWTIVIRGAAARRAGRLPSRVVTLAPRVRHNDLPEEVAMLLPANDGPAALADSVARLPEHARQVMLGLFLAGPFLNISLEGARLKRAGLRWIVNLPSVNQQDNDFVGQLTDVGLDGGRELAALAEFRAMGFSVAAVVADADGAAAAARIEPEAMLVMPRVADFAAGFPSLRQRQTAVHNVARTAREAGWSGLLLGLGESRDVESEKLWPTALDGLVCRPRRLAAPS